uniref:Secreted protein n=1 Tax=Panstrongylus lignarius TaxID=156445 RepID=A0A224Y0E1_9HEMI
MAIVAVLYIFIISLNTLQLIPRSYNLCHNPSWDTESKAFFRSMKIPKTFLHLCILFHFRSPSALPELNCVPRTS